MYNFFCVVCFFLILMVLVGGFHSFLWDASWSFLSGLRCWTGIFECGFLPQRSVENYFSNSYFILLVFFVVFDLEVSLLLNMPFQGLLYNNFFCYLLFLLLISFGFSFEIGKGYVGWSI